MQCKQCNYYCASQSCEAFRVQQAVVEECTEQSSRECSRFTSRYLQAIPVTRQVAPHENSKRNHAWNLYHGCKGGV